MTLREKIDYLKKQKSLNNRQLSIQSGIPYSTIDNWYKRADPDDMRLSTFLTLCSFFGVTLDSMAYDDHEIEYAEDVWEEYNHDEAELIRKYRHLLPDGQEMVNAVVDTALTQASAVSGSGEVSA